MSARRPPAEFVANLLRFNEKIVGPQTFESYGQFDSDRTGSNNGNIGFFPSGKGWDLLPSVTLGAGYNVEWKNGATGKFWCRPKIFWKIPFDNPAQPKFALQLGYSHRIK